MSKIDEEEFVKKALENEEIVQAINNIQEMLTTVLEALAKDISTIANSVAEIVNSLDLECDEEDEENDEEEAEFIDPFDRVKIDPFINEVVVIQLNDGRTLVGRLTCDSRYLKVTDAYTGDPTTFYGKDIYTIRRRSDFDKAQI